MACHDFDKGKHQAYVDTALRKIALAKYRKSEKIPITEFVNDFLDNLKSLDLFYLTSEAEIASLEDSLRDGVTQSRLLKDEQKDFILKNFQDVLYKNFNINPVVSTTPETNLDLEIKDDPDTVNDMQENSEDKILDFNIDRLYGKAVILKEFMLNSYRKNIVNSALVNFDTGRVIKNSKDLNRNIADYKNQLFKKIVDYIKDDNSANGITTDPHIIDYIYDTNGEPNTINMDKVLAMANDLFYNMDKARLSDAFLSRNLLVNGVARNRQLIDAYNAYVILSPGNFDKILSKLMGNSFKIKEIYKGEVSISSDKYLFEKVNSLRKSWGGSENVDAVTELGNISKLLIEQTPLYNNESNTIMEDQTLTLNQFLHSMNKLRDEQNLRLFKPGTKIRDWIIKFHDNPNLYLGLILKEIIDNNVSGRYFQASDMNVFRSVYERYYNRERPNSLFNIMRNDYKLYSNASTHYDLLETISGTVDRTNAAKYTQYSMNQDLDDMTVSEIRQSNNLRFRIQRDNDMRITNKLRTDRAKVMSDFNIQLANSITGDISFDLNVKGNVYTLTTNKNGRVGEKLIVRKNGSVVPLASAIAEPSFDAMKNFYERMGTSSNLNEEPYQVYLGIIKFSDTLLNTGFLRGNLDLLRSFKDVHEQGDSLNYLTESLMSMIGNAALANYVYSEFENNNTEYTNVGDFMKTIPYYQNIEMSEFGKYYDPASNSIKIITTNLAALEKLAIATQFVTGEIYKAVTKNAQGNNVPNSKMGNLAGLTRYWIESSIINNPDSSLHETLFAQNPDALLGNTVKTDAISRNGVKKSASNFTEAEHAYSSIMFDFYANLLKDSTGRMPQHVYTMPAVLSDKSSLYMWKTSVEGYMLNGESVNLSKASFAQLNELIHNTVGSYYRNTYDRVFNDYKQVYNDTNLNTYLGRLKAFADQDRNRLDTFSDKDKVKVATRIHNLDTAYTSINEKLTKLAEVNAKIDQDNITIQAKIDAIVAENQAMMAAGDFMINTDLPELKPRKTISDLLSMSDIKALMAVTTANEYNGMAYAAGIHNIENIHVNKGYSGKYTINGKLKKMAFIQPNSLLIYNATRLYNPKNRDIYDKQMLRESKKFIRDLITNNVSFPLVYSDGKENIILKNAIKQYIPDNQDKWINPYTKELILAKVDGKDITRLNPLDDVRNESKIELNPLLERYFLTDFLLSENLRLVTTGSELAHPDKSKSTHDLSMNMAELEESSRAGAQNKRNVIIPGTLQYFQQGSIMGVAPVVKIAIMPDVGASVHNYSGSQAEIDAHDGSAFNNPINSILENWSLQDSAVGEDKKPIGHDYNGDYGSAVLLKFATFSTYNWRMRVTQNSKINQYDLFRRMNSFEWDVVNDSTEIPHDIAANYEVDLTTNIFGKPMSLQDVLGGQRLFYDNNGSHYEILSIEKGINPKEYIITERPVDTLGNYIGEAIQRPPQIINNNYQLHQSLGGIYSESLRDGELVYSDASINATAVYVNNVGMFYGDENDYPNQFNTWQPLKHKMITYLVNKSAIKVGAEHLNEKSAWTDKNKALRFMHYNTKGLGIQMDADHIVTDGHSTMTEFSQVLSAVEANGYTHDIAKRLYKDLGKVALSAIAEEEVAVRKFINSGYSEEGKSKIYEIVGTYIIKELKNDGKDLGLAQTLVAKVKAEFAKRNKNHIDDEFKIPFSDPSIFGMALSAFTSAINKSAIKRKFPGLAAVMVPAYDMIQNFVSPDGKTYGYDAIRKRALIGGDTVEGYLTKLQLGVESGPAEPINKLLPGDIVKIPLDEVIAAAGNVDINQYAEMHNMEIEGNFAVADVKTYGDYTFLKNTFQSFYQDYTKPRNLQPQKVYWTGSDGKRYSIFDMPAVQYAFDKRSKGNVSKEEDLVIQANVTNTFKAVEAGFMPLTKEQSKERMVDPQAYDIAHSVVDMFGMKVMPYEQGSLINEPAEMVLSKIYAEKFNLNQNDSISDVLDQGPQFFVDRYAKYHTPKTQNYNVCYTRGNGKHMYIVFEGDSSIENLDANKLDNESLVRDGDNLYRVNNEGRKLYRAGFYDENNEYHSLINSYMASDTTSLEEVLVVKNADEALALYNSKEFDSIVINGRSIGSEEQIRELIDKGSESIVDFSELKLASDNVSLSDMVAKVAEINKAKIAGMAQKKFVSFQKSLEFTVARIPAQTMQSFMKMKVSQFSESDKNVVYVSHWQTWLQGSDYDIDKAYIMGYDFDDNGVYVGWSPFFNYSSVEALKKSEKLPTPNEKKYKYTDNPVATDITEYILKLNPDNFYKEESLDDVIALLNLVDDIDDIELTYDKAQVEGKNARFILNKINEHNSYMQLSYNKQGRLDKGEEAEDKIAPKNILPSFRNAVSSKISDVIINLKNANSAYTPINMDAPQEAASKSRLGEEAARITYTTPSSKYLMISQNMDGKSVIGIAAVGAKVFFGTSYYFNEGLRSNDPNWINNMFFQRTFAKLQRTLSEDGKPITVPTMRNIMANVNFDNIKDKEELIRGLITNAVEQSMSQSDVARIVQEQLGLQPDQSLVISALLSAATDNAKELILSKINAGPALAGIYLHLIMLGFDFNDIADLMISPTVQTINDLAKTNIFDDYHDGGSTVIDMVITSLEEGPNINKYLDKQGQANLYYAAKDKYGYSKSQKDWLKEIVERFKSGRELDDKFFPAKTVNDYRFLEEYKYLQQKAASIDIDRFEQFKQIKEEAKETQLVGRIFGLNQGMKTDLAGKIAFLNMLESGMASREAKFIKSLGTSAAFLEAIKADKPYLSDGYIINAYNAASDSDIIGNFDIRKFLNPDNLEYRKAAIDYYNCLKGVWNIYDMIDKIPHFKALYKVLFMTDVVDTKISNKFEVIDTLRKMLVENSKNKNISEDKLMGLSEYVDDALITSWLDKENITFTLNNGATYFDKNNKRNTVETESERFNLASDDGRATFKLWFEQTVIPNLKTGVVNGRTSPKLRNNYFIQGLQMAERTDPFSRDTVVYAKLPIDMMNIKAESDQANFSRYKDSFAQLKSLSIQGRPLTDWFFIYNLVVNKNKYGSDRLTTLFSKFLEESGNDSIINAYENYVGRSDYSSIIDMENFELDDAQMRMAPVVAKNQLYRSNDPYIRLYNIENRRYDIMKKVGDTYSPVLDLDSQETRDYYNYFVMRTPRYTAKIRNLKLDPSNTALELYSKIINLMARNTLKIEINCE